MGTTPDLIGKRYQLHEQLGAGGMGAVYRATDRLTGQTVALKRVTVPGEQLQFASQGDSANFRLALAQEFKVLASLRHPHIISVLDYGFAENRQPYFTMELLENAQTITAYGQGKPLPEQVALLVQVLQALAYLHRRGIIHRDLKPDNTMVVNGQVKVLDFGLAVAREHLGESSETVGTIAYMAPEVLQGSPASEAADLYAVGVMAYEVFAGRHPFNTGNFNQLIQDIVHTTPDVWGLKIDEPLPDILDKLLAKSPDERYGDANELIRQYAEATGQQAQYETATIRESFLQAAQFVGREAELKVLTDAFAQAMQGTGSAWLVGGESGVGKSRLLDELRTQAIVEGALVLRGQAIAEGGAPYLLWREALRRLCLQTDLSELEASVLKTLVPDIGTLIGRDVPDAPEIDPQAAQTRLLTVIEDLFRKQTRPIVLLLEDLQWASESLAALKRLNQAAGDLSLLVVANYRNDERPDLPAELPGMQPLKLPRLSGAAIADLSAAMLGEGGRQAQVVDLLQRETEGNVFFIVEVVRTLAEEAGQLDRVGSITLPQKIVAGGMQAVVQRRLKRVPEPARPLLEIAAVAGRELDLNVLRAAARDVNLDSWLAVCADASVLDVQEGRWRFAHDKLREGMLADLTDDQRRTLNRRAAETLEKVYPDNPAQLASLAYHWAEAGDIPKEAHYAALAGEQALSNGAYQEAVNFLERTLAVAEPVHLSRPQQAVHKQQLGDAYLGLGQLSQSQSCLEGGLALLGEMPPKSPIVFVMSLIGQILHQAWHRLKFDVFGRPMNSASHNRGLATAVRTCERLGQLAYIHNDLFALVYYIFRETNLAEQIGSTAQADLLRSYASMAGTVDAVNHRFARMYYQRSQALMQDNDDKEAESWANLVLGLYASLRADWEDVQHCFQRCIQLAEQTGNRRRWGEGTCILGFTYCLSHWDIDTIVRLDYPSLSTRQGDLQVRAMLLDIPGEAALRLGRFDEALDLLQQSAILYEQIEDRALSIRVYGLLTQLHLRLGNYDEARQCADQAATLIAASVPVAFYALEGYAGSTEFALSLWETQPSAEHRTRARAALKFLRQFAFLADIVKPRAATLQGWYHWLDGKPAKARKAGLKGIAEAQRLKMPYDEGIAHYHLGRFLPKEDPQRAEHLKQAVTIFERLGAAWDLEQAKTLL